MINDDSPAVRTKNGILHLFGTPWSGKTDINHNIHAPFSFLVFLEQGKENKLTKLSTAQVNFLLLRELARPVYPELSSMTLDFMGKIIENVPAYLLQCTISEEAAKLSYSLL